MNIILFGATGMVGQGVLRECLIDSNVGLVVTVGRAATGDSDPKLQEIAHPDMWDYSSIENKLSGFDACFFCLGVSSAGVNAHEYERVTYGITMAAAETLCRLNPEMTFIYVSGRGTDSSEEGRVRWARVKGRTENSLMRLPFKAAYMFRPGFIEPVHGVQSKTTAYRILYSMSRPLLPLLRFAFPNAIVTTEQIGRAMLAVSRNGASMNVLEAKDILSAANSLDGSPPGL